MDARNNAILSGNFADLLTDYVNIVVERLSSLTIEDLSPVVQATSDIITAALAGGGNGDVASAQLSNLAVVERARRYIQNHLNVATLTPDDISRAVGVSRTRLYKLFEPSGGVLAYVQKRRLMAAHDALGDPTEERLIVDIAEACGFSSAANFSRAFSKEFGYSPREARSALATTRHAGAKSHAARRASSSFDEWLKNAWNLEQRTHFGRALTDEISARPLPGKWAYHEAPRLNQQILTMQYRKICIVRQVSGFEDNDTIPLGSYISRGLGGGRYRRRHPR